MYLSPWVWCVSDPVVPLLPVDQLDVHVHQGGACPGCGPIYVSLQKKLVQNITGAKQMSNKAISSKGKSYSSGKQNNKTMYVNALSELTLTLLFKLCL